MAKSNRVVYAPVYLDRLAKDKKADYQKEVELTLKLMLKKYSRKLIRHVEIGRNVKIEDYEGIPVVYSDDNVGEDWLFLVFKNDNLKRGDLKDD